MSTEKQSSSVDPIDVEIGGDADVPGIAQTVTLHDIHALAYGAAPLEERRQKLGVMREEMRARLAADGGGDIAALLDEVERAMATLDQPATIDGTRASVGKIPEDRVDGQAPDEREP